MWNSTFCFSLQARSRISSTIKAIIEERRRKDDGDDSKKNDFLEILLCVDTLSEDEKVSFVLDSLLGGYETTSLLMAMIVFFVGQSQTVLHQLKVITSLSKSYYFLYWIWFEICSGVGSVCKFYSPIDNMEVDFEIFDFFET